MNTESVLTIASSVLGSIAVVLSKPLIDWYRARKSVEGEHEDRENKHEIDVTSQAIGAYQALITTLTGQIDKMAEKMEKMEAAHIQCQVENAKLRVSVEAYQKQSEKLQSCVEALEAKVEALSQRLQTYEES